VQAGTRTLLLTSLRIRKITTPTATMKNFTTLCLLAILAIAGCVQHAAANRADEAFNEWAAPRVLAVEQTEDPVERILQQLGETAAPGGYSPPEVEAPASSPPPSEEVGGTPAPPSPSTSSTTTLPGGTVPPTSFAPVSGASTAATSIFALAAAAAVAALAF